MRPIRPTSKDPLGTSLRAWGRSCDGGVAVTVAVMTTVLVGLLALSIDVGRIYNASTERNNAADAAAVAAATQLDGSQFACNRAIRAAAAGALANQETFVSNRTGPDVYISPIGSPDGTSATVNPNIQFLSELNHDPDGNVTGTYITNPANCDVEAVYVEVTVDLAAAGTDAEVDLYFAGITGALTQAFPKGYAVAQAHELFCAEVPLFMCPLEGTADSFWADIVDYEHTGKGVWLKSENNADQYLDGNFGFLRLLNKGAGDLGEFLGKVNPLLNCLSVEEIKTEPGANESAARGFNTRVGIYHTSMSSEEGDFEWQPSVNSVKGYVRDNSNRCEVSNSGYQLPTTPYTGYPSYGGDSDAMPPFVGALNLPPITDPSRAMPLPMDEKAYPGGSCAVSGAQGRMCDGYWQADVYWAMNHPTLAAAHPDVQDLLDPFSLVHGSGTTAVDIPWPGPKHQPFGDDLISRYEMYLWEMDRPMKLVPHPKAGDACCNIPADTQIYVPDDALGGSYNSLGMHNRLVDNTDPADGGLPGGFPQEGEYAGAQCGTIGPVSPALKDDRRVIDVLLVDCDNLVKDSGNFTVPRELIKGSIDVFVVNEWTFGGGEHDLYVEIIGPGEDSGFLTELSRNWVTLNESRNATK